MVGWFALIWFCHMHNRRRQRSWSHVWKSFYNILYMHMWNIRFDLTFKTCYCFPEQNSLGFLGHNIVSFFWFPVLNLVVNVEKKSSNLVWCYWNSCWCSWCRVKPGAFLSFLLTRCQFLIIAMLFSPLSTEVLYKLILHLICITLKFSILYASQINSPL
jgi:hypothetical protein